MTLKNRELVAKHSSVCTEIELSVPMLKHETQNIIYPRKRDENVELHLGFFLGHFFSILP